MTTVATPAPKSKPLVADRLSPGADPTASPSLHHQLCAIHSLLNRDGRPLAGAELETAAAAISEAVDEADRLECLASDVNHLASVMAEAAQSADNERLEVLARTVAEKIDLLDWHLVKGWPSGEAAPEDVEEDEEDTAGIRSLEGIAGARERLKLSIATAARVFECEDGDRAAVQSLSAAVWMIEDAHVALEQLLDEVTSAGAAPVAAPTAAEIPIPPDGGDLKPVVTLRNARQLCRDNAARLSDVSDLADILCAMVVDLENELPAVPGRRLATLARRVNADVIEVSMDSDTLDEALAGLVIAERAKGVGAAPAAPTSSTPATTRGDGEEVPAPQPADLELLSCGAACVSDLATLCSNEEESTLARAVAHHANLVNNFASSLFDGGRLDEARAELRNAVHPTVIREEV